MGELKDGRTIEGETFFLTCIPIEYEKIAAQFGCQVLANPNRLREARKTWISEIERQQVEGGGVPDQFKHAGLLAYWLRRYQVIDMCELVISYDTSVGRLHQRRFKNAPSELSAFVLGFNLAAYYTYPRYASEEYSIKGFMRDTRPTDAYLHDMCLYLKEKHVSPHSLYLIYRAFFETPIRWSGGRPRSLLMMASTISPQ